MSKDDKETSAEATPKKSKKKLLMIIVLALVVLGGGGGAYYMFAVKGGDKVEKPVKGAVIAMDDALTINLADAHYLKLGFSLQATEEAGSEAIDNSEAIDLAIDQYTGKTVAELETEKGREKAKADLLEQIEKVYNTDGAHIIMDIYFTQFVTQ